MVLNTLVWIVAIIVIAIVIIVLVKFLFNVAAIAPYAYADKDADREEKQIEADDEPIVEGKETIDIGNGTQLKITCTSNIPDLVSC